MNQQMKKVDERLKDIQWGVEIGLSKLRISLNLKNNNMYINKNVRQYLGLKEQNEVTFGVNPKENILAIKKPTVGDAFLSMSKAGSVSISSISHILKRMLGDEIEEIEGNSVYLYGKRERLDGEDLVAFDLDNYKPIEN